MRHWKHLYRLLWMDQADCNTYWKNEYDTWENAIQMTRGACYAFIMILAAISIMNLINTMINSVHVRKKELGMMQAISRTVD